MSKQRQYRFNRGTPWQARVVRHHATDCLLWLGPLTADGYGRWGTREAHRAVYEAERGPIPVGLELDHLCRNTPCVNPAHLEPVTHAVNMQRAALFGSYVSGYGLANARKTHCPAGHPYDEDNTEMTNRGQSRRCVTCRRERDRAAKAVARAEGRAKR